MLAVVALGIAAWFLYTQNRPQHHAVPIIEPDAAKTASPDDDDAGASVTPDITLAPVLAPPSGVKVPWWKDAEAGAPTGENKDCAMARWQKEHGRPASSYEPLEARCRAAGGKL